MIEIGILEIGMEREKLFVRFLTIKNIARGAKDRKQENESRRTISC